MDGEGGHAVAGAVWIHRALSLLLGSSKRYSVGKRMGSSSVCFCRLRVVRVQRGSMVNSSITM